MHLSEDNLRRFVISALLAAIAIVGARLFLAHTQRLDTEPVVSRSPAAATSESHSMASRIADSDRAQERSVGMASSASAPGDSRETLDGLLLAALEITAPDQRRRALRFLAEKLADANDTVTAGDFVAGMLGPDDRAAHGDAYTFTKIFADRLARRNPQAVIDWSSGLPDALKEIAYPFVARHSVELDLKALTEWTLSIDSAALRATLLRATGQQLRTGVSERAASDWALALARSPDGARFSDLVVEHWAGRDFHAAAEWAAGLAGRDDREFAFLSLATVGGERAPALALSWAASLPAGELRTRVFHQSLTAWATRDPSAAAAWCDANASQPGMVTQILPQIASAWMQRDPDAAVRWIARAPISGQTKTYLLSLAAAQRGASQ